MHSVQEKNPDLKIPIALAVFLKRWKFTRDSLCKEKGDDFVAIYNGKQYLARFNGGEFVGLWVYGITYLLYPDSVAKMNNFMRNPMHQGF